MEDGFAMGYAMGQDSNGGNRNDGGFGGANSWIWIIVVFALLFGWGNNGNNGNSGNGGNCSGGDGSMAAFLPYIAGSVNANGAVTRADLCSEFNFNNLDSAVRGISNGICSLGYDQLAQINGVNSNISAGFAGVNNSICTLGYQNAQLINGLENTVQNGFNSSNIVALQNQNALQAQLSQCCCENREGQAQIRYDMAANNCAVLTAMNNNTRDIIDSQNAGTRAILDYLCQEKISDLQAENQNLKLAASQERQNNYLVSQLRPTPNPAFVVPNPFTGTFGGYGSFGGCGCFNSGCGCGNYAAGCGC